MNREKYNSDPRYAKVLETMDLLGIVDITTTRQDKNGTIVWKLPIKNEWNGSLIEVASFKTGYVRNQNSASSNYQLNKTKKNYEKTFSNGYEWWSTERILIPIEIDRLEYLISYCLKNYYIGKANQVADGNYIPKWKYDNLADAARIDHERNDGALQNLSVIVNNERYRII
jgi:hypothetical protein|tara:strand:- start:22 stop:534 length:513 start_codon:yes stop_codon:yes gene_type:complete